MLILSVKVTADALMCSFKLESLFEVEGSCLPKPHACDNNNNNELDEQTFSSEPYQSEPQGEGIHTDPVDLDGDEEKLIISEWYKPCVVLHYIVYECYTTLLKYLHPFEPYRIL